MPTHFFTQPDPASKIPNPPVLSADQVRKVQAVLDHFNQDGFVLPLSLKAIRALHKQRKTVKGGLIRREGSPTGTPFEQDGIQLLELMGLEKCFLSYEQIQRFCRAVKWDLERAIMRAEEVVVWRREFGVDIMKAEHVEPEALTGKELVNGYDFDSRPCLYMYPNKQNTKVGPRQIEFVVWELERAIDMMPPGVEKLCLLIDFGGSGGQPTTPSQAKKVLDILQTMYCERLGRAICVNVPMAFTLFYKIVSPFVDPVTKEKIQFNPDVRTLVPPSQLPKESYKGDVDFTYEHAEFWPKINDHCLNVRAEQLKRWQDHGDNKCGLSEFIIKGSQQPSKSKSGVLDENSPSRSSTEASSISEGNLPPTPETREELQTPVVGGKDDEAIGGTINRFNNFNIESSA